MRANVRIHRDVRGNYSRWMDTRLGMLRRVKQLRDSCIVCVGIVADDVETRAGRCRGGGKNDSARLRTLELLPKFRIGKEGNLIRRSPFERCYLGNASGAVADQLAAEARNDLIQ